MRKELSIDEKQGIVNAYNAGTGLEAIATEFHVGKLKVKAVLDELGVKQQAKHLRVPKQYVVKDASIKKYPDVPGKHYVCTCKLDGFKTNDYMNKGGFLTSHLEKECGIEVPTLWKRNEYYKLTGNYWHEQYYDIELVDDNPTIKCPYCDWTSEDVDNKSGMFETHLKKVHGITKMEFIHEHPEWRDYFRLVNKTKDREMETDESKFVTCAICGKKLARIDWKHLQNHGITVDEYKALYGEKTISNSLRMRLHESGVESNLLVQHNFSSVDENELLEYVKRFCPDARKDRTLLNGQELDIFIPSKHIAIEFNGCMWHTEQFGGKSTVYHLAKTEICEYSGVRLIHVFEDEWHLHQEMVKRRIAHILGFSMQPSIYARKCTVREISIEEAKTFLDAYDMSGFSYANVHFGMFSDNNLLAVMSLRITGENEWQLSRFATNDNYRLVGACGKLLSYFKERYNPNRSISYADRRWTTAAHNMYTATGFTFSGYTKPLYRYYNQKQDRYKRWHERTVRNILLKHGWKTSGLSKLEMARSLGYDRIWDCGLIRYVWSKSSD
jgi:hypothetical protein